MPAFEALDDVLTEIKTDLDTQKIDRPDDTKVSVLFAYNGSGKTRLSKMLYDQNDEHVLYYNAFTEDLFAWDNDDFHLKIDPNAWLIKFIEREGLDSRVVDNFKKFTGTKLEPAFDFQNSRITFNLFTGEENPSSIKVSRGEESVFIWSIFFTVLDFVVDALNEPADERSTDDFDNTQYIVIDDPVSSMDDTRIITVALALAELIKKSRSQLKFLITTHHALFFNVLFNIRKKNKKWDGKNYILSKNGTGLFLKTQSNDSPFAYHHVIKHELKEAIKNNDMKKYHFNLLRALLEKTANFLGYAGWKECLKGLDVNEGFIKTIDHYSHDRLSDLDAKDLSDDDKRNLKEGFELFEQKIKWGSVQLGEPQ
jgi:hypothetical protein